MYNTVIFDLDGTLLNTLEDLCDSTNYALRQHGYPERSIGEVRRFVGNGVRKLVERALPGEVSDREFERVFNTFRTYYQLHCNDKTGPYGGIMDLLKELHDRGYTLGIASNKNRDAVIKLNNLYFDGIIDCAFGVAEGIMPKPDPSMISLLLKELDSDAGHTLYVGDSQVDIETAGNAGLDMVTVLWGFRDEEELREAGAGVFIREPMELLKYL